MSSRVGSRGAGSRVGRAVLVGAGLVVVMMTGCRVDATVGVTVNRDGGGRVRVEVVLDDDAARELGEEASRLRVEDLRAAGWSLDPPDRSRGGVRFSASKPFRGPDDLVAVLDEVAGRDGWLRGWELQVTNSFARTTYELRGRVEVSGDLRELGDAGTAASLDGYPVGRSPDELAAALGGSGDGASLTVRLSVPGSAPTQRRVDVTLGEAHRVDVAAEGTVSSRRTQLLVALTTFAAVAGLVALVMGRVRARRDAGDASAGEG